MHGQNRQSCTSFWLKPAGIAPEAIGLPSSLSRCSLSAIAFAANTFKPDKDLQDDKEGYAVGVVGKRDSYVA